MSPNEILKVFNYLNIKTYFEREEIQNMVNCNVRCKNPVLNITICRDEATLLVYDYDSYPSREYYKRINMTSLSDLTKLVTLASSRKEFPLRLFLSFDISHISIEKRLRLKSIMKDLPAIDYGIEVDTIVFNRLRRGNSRIPRNEANNKVREVLEILCEGS